MVIAVSARADSEGGHIEYADGKSFKSIYCTPIGSGALQYIGAKTLDKVIEDAIKEEQKYQKVVKAAA